MILLDTHNDNGNDDEDDDDDGHENIEKLKLTLEILITENTCFVFVQLCKGKLN